MSPLFNVVNVDDDDDEGAANEVSGHVIFDVPQPKYPSSLDFSGG